MNDAECGAFLMLVELVRGGQDAAVAEEAMRARLAAWENWPALFRLASAHRVLPAVGQALRTRWRESVSATAIAEVEQRYFANAARNVQMAEAQARLAAVLVGAGIDAIPFKGPALALQAYGDLGARQFDDLDFLVEKRDIRAATRCLAGEGYKAVLNLSDRQMQWQIDAGWGCALQAADRPAFRVELDSSVVPDHFPASLDMGVLGRRREMVEDGAIRLRTLDRPSAMLLLAIHGTKHVWHRLGWLLDMKRLADRLSEMEWGVVMERASQAGCRRLLLTGLDLAHGLFGGALPPSMEAEVRADPWIGRLSQETRARLVGGRGMNAPWRSKLRFHLESRERIADRFRHLWRLATTPSHGDWTAVPLPRALFALYFIIRPIRLACTLPGRLSRRR